MGSVRKMSGLSDTTFGLVQIIERLHRHYLDVLRTELRRLGIEEINAVQALLLANIGTEEVVIRDLKDRGYYHGSNVSYNIKKLTELGYIGQERCSHDRRAIRVGLTDKGMDLCERMRELQKHLSTEMDALGLPDAKLTDAMRDLETVERCWTDFIRYGRR